MRKRRWLWACGLLVGNVIGGHLIAQGQVRPKPMPVVVGGAAHGSFIIAHRVNVKHLAVSHPTGFELNLQQQTNGSEAWHAWYRYPKVGVALVYYDYHNLALGKSYAASIYLNKAIWRTQKQELNFRLGTGLGYFPTRFDANTNHKNNIISSRLNAIIQARLEYDVALTPHLGLVAGLGLNHFSNGATSKPNLGINLPTVLLGLNYHQQRQFRPLSPIPVSEAGITECTFFNLSASVGVKQRDNVDLDPNRYLVNSVTLSAGRRVNRKSNLVVGVEGFYDRSLLAELKDSARTSDRLPDVKKAGGYFGHELLFGRLAFVSHLGFYFYNPYKSNKFYYERLGLKYHFTEHLFGSMDLKVHRGAADVIEWRLGLKI